MDLIKTSTDCLTGEEFHYRYLYPRNQKLVIVTSSITKAGIHYDNDVTITNF
jgi:hypothetical protein